MDPTAVTASLVTSGQPWRHVEFHEAIGSTNDRAKQLVQSYAAGPATTVAPLWWVVLTDHQTGGRGRLGRVWEVPARASLAVSAVVPVDDLGALGWLPLCAGLALARAVTSVTAAAGHELHPRLKWPNDLLLADDDDRKVSGILCELVALGDGRHAVVVGTGVNVDQSRDELPVDTATSLALAGTTVGREDLVVAYLRELAPLVAPRPGTETVARAAYRAACSTIGSAVRVHLPSGAEVTGTATGIDGSGALVVDTAAGRQAFSAGDVVHVRRR